MRRKLQLAATFLTIITTATYAQTIHSPQIKQKEKKQKPSVNEWLWQYSPPPADGRENDLIRDPHFLPFLKENLTTPQTFWGVPGHTYKSLAETVYDFLSVPGKVIADDNRYITVTGCVFHFCPARGLLWVDLNAPETFVVFAAIDWIRDSKTPQQPEAEYTLWIFSNRSLGLTPEAPGRIPEALTRSLGRWAAEPVPGTKFSQNITHAIVVDPDGTPHQVSLASVGLTSKSTDSDSSTETKEKP